MKKYMDYIGIGFWEHIVYKNAVITKLFSKVLYLYLQFHIWTALFTSNSLKNRTLDQDDTLRYVMAATLVSSLLECNIIERINAQIQSGNIATDLIRPVNFRKMIFAKSFGDTLAKGLCYFLPLTIVIYVTFSLPIVYKGQLIIGLVSVLLAYGIQFFYSLIIGLLAFWLIVTWPINMFLDAIYKLFSGIWIPLSMFPDTLYRINLFFPFRAIYSIPVTILIHRMDDITLFRSFAVQIVCLSFYG